jgi:hypothetical protein
MRQTKMNVIDGYIIWKDRTIIPLTYRKKIISEIYNGHMGIVKMKEIASNHVWWPGIRNYLEKITNSSEGCSNIKSSRYCYTLNPWEWPDKPGNVWHIDLACPMFGYMHLIYVDAYSKWMEIFHIKSTIADATINKLQEMFSFWGLRDIIFSDNRPQFIFDGFKQFCVRNGIITYCRHLTIPIQMDQPNMLSSLLKRH